MRAVPITVFPRLIFLGAFLTAVALLLLVFTAPANAANAPSGFTATAGDTQVTLSWNNPSDTTITGYRVLTVAIDKLTGSTSATGDRFGESVGVDNNWAVVGAPLEDTTDGVNAITDSGLVHVFKRSSGNWNSELTPSYVGAARDDEIGASVAVSGGTVVFGVPKYDHEVSNILTRIDAGRFFVYLDPPGSALGWGTPHNARGGAAGDWFGTSVAIDGGTAIVGAPVVQVGTHQFAGKAYVHTENTNGSWSEKAALDAGTNAGLGYAFGTSVAVDGSTAVVGAFGEDSGKGAVYVFTKNGNAWPRTTRLTAPGAANDDSFGRWVAVDGDFVVVGSWRDDDDGTDSGSVYVFTKPSGGWGDWNGLSSNAKDQLTAKLTASDAAAEDHFGWSVAVDGDNVVVGAYGNDDNGNDSGSVYLFTKPTSGGWVTATETVKLTAPDGAAGDNFGYSVAAGGGRAIVGAPGDDSEKGAVYVFSIPEWTDISSSDSGTTSHTVTGLDNDVEYTFLVRPVVGSGYGSASESKQATPRQSPAATPANLTALAGVDQVTLSWDDPNDSTISAYKYRQKEGSGSFGQWTTIPDSAYGEANTTGYTVRNLTDGQTYTFRIRAVDEAGDTANSGDVTVTTILAAPATLMATVGAGQIELNWANPSNDLITKYQYSTDGGTSFTDIPESTATTATYTVTGLDNGTEYTLAVRAVNDSVNGEAATITATPLLPAPTNLVATPYSERVVLEWDTGGVGYEQYQITIETSGTGVVPTPYIVSASSEPKTSVEITPLTDNTAYTFAVQAVDVPSGVSGTPKITGMAATVTATPIPVPAAPANLTAAPRDAKVELSWADPDNDTITKYELLQLAQRKLTAGSDAEFGYSVAVVGDIAVVGAPGDDENSGAVLVFTRDSSGDWSQAAKLKASDAAADDEFGSSVAFDGDTIVLGAPFDDDDDNGDNSGSAYVFTKSSGVWGNAPPSGDHRIETAKLTASDGAADDEFGWNAVAVDGDTIVVGAYADDGTKGAAYVFTKPGTGWATATETAKLTANDAEDGDYFGDSVAVDGAVIVVGASGDDGTALQFMGSALVFVKPGTGWDDSTETAKLTASTRGTDDYFGPSVAIDGDTVVVGAYQHDSNMGSAFVYIKPGTGWDDGTETAKLTASDAAAGDKFGYSVAVEDDIVVVGAYGDNSARGSAYIFTKPATGWVDGTEAAQLAASVPNDNDRFGSAVAVDGDTLVVGTENGNAAHVFDVVDWDDIPDSTDATTAYTITGLTNNITYTFAVRAVNPSGNGPASTASATPMPVPAAPLNLSATPGDGQVALSWTAGDDTITGYEYSIDNGGTFTAITDSGANTTGYTVTGLNNGVTYTLALRAVNDFGNGMPSTIEVLMIPAAPKLSAAAGDTAVALSWADPGNGTINSYQLWQVGEFIGLQPSDGTTDHFFGHSVAVDGDTAVIGAPQDAEEPGLVYVFTRNSSGAWSQQGILTTTVGSDFSFFGSSVAVHGDTAVVGAPKDFDGNGVKTGAVYVFTRDSLGAWSQQARLTASDGGLNDEFGISVGVDGDTVVVGAWKTGKGAAYVFTRNDGVWDGGVNLTASDGKEDDEFGISVALNGKTLVVGAPRNDKYIGNNINEEDAGAAYVFTKPTGGWGAWDDLPQTDDDDEDKDGLTAKLTASDRAEDDFFGQSVALDDDTILVGAPGDNNNDNRINSGSVYLFAMPSDGWGDLTEDQKLTASDGAVEDMFGNSVTLDGDTAVVGAYRPTYTNFSTEVISRPGATYVFTRDSSDMWRQAARMTASDSADGDQFGYSVAMDGSSVFIGAYKEVVAVGSGSVYTTNTTNWLDISGSDATTTSHNVAGLTNYQEYWFQIRAVNETGEGPASNSSSATPRLPKPGKPANLTAEAGDQEVMLQWANPGNSTIDKYQISEVIEEGFLTASDGATGDHFGVSVAIDGDTAVVGADRLNARKGAAYIFTRDSNGAWTQQAKLDGEFAGDQFGWSVAVEGDTVVVGAHAYDGEDAEGDGLENSGATYVYTKPATGGGWADTIAAPAKLTATVPEAYAFFGGSVALDGNTLAIGSRLYNAGSYLSAGAAYVFTKSGTTWSQQAKLTASTSLQLAYLGYSLAVDGDTVLVGAYGDDTIRGELGSGSAYVFDKPSGGWSAWDALSQKDKDDLTAKLTASDRQPSGYFGFSVALDGDTAVIGARQHNDPKTGAGSGAAYVFARESGVWGEKARLTPSDAAAGDNFGVSVAVEGDTVVVGSWQDDDNGRNSGSAYVFEKPALGWTSTFETLKLTAPDGAVNDRFGWSVAVDLDDVRGDLALVGAYSDDHDVGDDGSIEINAGSVHVLGIPDWKDIPDSVATTTAHTVTKELDNPNTDTDLSNGTEYAFQVRALNQSGAGPASDGVSATPLGPPAALNGLMSEDGDTQVRLYWTAATADATIAPVTKYIYQYQVKQSDGIFGDWTNWADMPDSGPTTTEYTKTGLENKDHKFRVRAVNVIGEGPVSTVDATPASARPDQPTNLTATVGDTQVRLTWNDPNDSSIDKYEYRWKEGTEATDFIDTGDNKDEWTQVPDSNADTTRYTVIGLTNGTSYAFQVRAWDDGADPEDSLPAQVAGTPLSAPPAAPTGLMADPDDSLVTLTWDDPDDSTIARYEYRQKVEDSNNSNGFSDWMHIPSSEPTTTEYTVTDLHNGTKYTFEVRAVESHSGTEEESDPSADSATPLPDRPGAPTDLNVTARNQEVTLTWRAPLNSVIDKYEVLHLQASALVNPGVTEGDKFGYSVAVDGDIAVVGAYRDGENDVTDSGAAYVFTRSGGVVWDRGVKLTASDGAPYNNFGISVAVDGETVVVGAPGDDDNGTDSGSVYVFTNTNGVWSQAAKLTASDGATLDYFGQSVAVSGDTILVGAYLDDREETITDSELEDSGSVYVFVKPSGGWATGNETAKRTASDAADDDNFGTSVALDGNTAVIGAPGADDNDNGIDSGSAYVFTRNASTGAWSQQTKLTASSDGAAGDALGISVALDGDTAVVGAYLDDREDNTMTTDVDEAALDAGSAYVFTRDSGTWSQQAKLMANDRQADDWFGYSVAVDGNIALVGAFGDDDNGSNAGSAYVFTRNTDAVPITWSETNKLTEDAGQAGARFGYSVAVDTTAHTVLVGAGSAHVMDIHDWAEVPGGSGARSHIFAELTNGRKYDLQVRAVNLAGEGDEADQSAVPHAPQGGNNEAGVVSLSPAQPVVNIELTASLADPNGPVPVSSVSWRWSRSSDGTTGWSDIPGANSNRYIPIAADVGNYLRASASYTDAFGPGQSAAAVSAARVQSAPVGNNDPYFIDDTLTLTVAENTPVGQNVGRAVTATDPDHDTLTYSLSGTDVAYFDIAPATGQITVGSGATLNYESGATSYTVIVSVHDGSPDSAIDDSIDVTINVADANDAPEAVTDTLNINENSGSTHLNVIANDNDEDGDTLSINVVNGAAVISTPSKGTAVVKAGSTAEITYTPNSTATGPDTFTYEVSDGNGGTDVGTVNVTITPLPSGSDDDPPVNDSPRFNEGASVTRTVPENAAVGTAVGDPVTARDRNNDRLEYSLSGTDRASFDIDRSTGQLTTSTLLDYEVQNEYSVRVQVEDGQGGVAGIDATITVMDVDEPPAQPEAPEVRSAGLTSLAVGWTAPDNQGPEITDYDLRYREVGGEFQDAGYSGIGTSWALNDLSPTTGYEVQVRAINAEGISPWSESGRGETGQALSTPAPTPVLEITPTPDPAQAGTPTSTPGPGDASARTPTPTPTPTVRPMGTTAPAQTPGPVVAPATVPATPPAAVGTVPTPTATQAPSASVPEPTTAMPPAAPAEPDSGRGFPIWLIAAIVVAGLLAIVLGYLGVRMLRR